MKKLLTALLCATMAFGIVGCGNKESDLDKVSKVFTFETKDVEGSTVGLVKDGDTVKFTVYVTLDQNDTELSQELGIKEGEILYDLKGDEKETYFVDLNKMFVTVSNTTPEAAKENMNAYLKEKGITIDQLKAATKEKFMKK